MTFKKKKVIVKNILKKKIKKNLKLKEISYVGL
jgi:hypothetical protein